MSASQWGYWLAGDLKRMSRENFIGVTVRDSSIKPSFTTVSTEEVYRILVRLVQRNN